MLAPQATGYFPAPGQRSPGMPPTPRDIFVVSPKDCPTHSELPRPFVNHLRHARTPNFRAAMFPPSRISDSAPKPRLGGSLPEWMPFARQTSPRFPPPPPEAPKRVVVGPETDRRQPDQSSL